MKIQKLIPLSVYFLWAIRDTPEYYSSHVWSQVVLIFWLKGPFYTFPPIASTSNLHSKYFPSDQSIWLLWTENVFSWLHNSIHPTFICKIKNYSPIPAFAILRRTFKFWWMAWNTVSNRMPGKMINIDKERWMSHGSTFTQIFSNLENF